MGRYLMQSGIHIGDELLGPHSSNPYGHFEDTEILAFHRRVLRRANAGEDQWLWRVAATTQTDRRAGEELVARRRALGRPWGWKEPRTCLFLKFWADIIPEAIYLCVFRDPQLVLHSLLRRHERSRWSSFDVRRFLRTWLFYNEQILTFSQQNPGRSILFPLSGALKHPEAFAARLSDRIPLTFSAALLRECYDAEVLSASAPRATARPLLMWQCQRLHTRMLRHSALTV